MVYCLQITPVMNRVPALTGHASVVLSFEQQSEEYAKTPTIIVTGGTNGKTISDKTFAIILTSDQQHYIWFLYYLYFFFSFL